MSLSDFYIEFMQELYARSGAEGDFNESVCTERMCEFLIDQAIIDNYTYIGFRKTDRGIRVDAWDYNEDTVTLDLFITDFRSEPVMQTLIKTDVAKFFRRAERFFTESQSSKFYQALEESTPGYELAREIAKKSTSISHVRFFLLSNAELSQRVGSIGERSVKGYRCSYDIWDISRIYRIESSGKSREDIIIDFQSFIDQGIPCLPAFTGSNTCESYLLVMPGKLIAHLYEQYGERLLEQNVRTFLQFRGKINKGIRNTIINEPDMFFAYNNGLTATAEKVITDSENKAIRSVTNLQIVNGGQTTASLFTVLQKQQADADIYVQVKLSVIAPDQVETVVPRISEYANTQNRVNAADFFSNHPFHLRIEEISRRIWAPSSEGSLRETHWFYERTRGQYANAQANLTPSRKKEFTSINPRSQMFTKTDLAKYEHSLDMLPHIVSLGAQKNFARFASEVGTKWDKNEKQFNELYFKRLIAKAILFRFLDKSIMKQDWYAGGYKANIVTYTLAKFSRMISQTGMCFDFERLWKEQGLSKSVQNQLLMIAELVNEKIQDTPDGITNVTEWCKRESCWMGVQELQIALNPTVRSELVESETVKAQEKSAEKNQKLMNGIQSQTYVVEKGKDYWEQIRGWNDKIRIFTPKELGILNQACRIPLRIPSEKQSFALIEMEEKAIEEGFSAS